MRPRESEIQLGEGRGGASARAAVLLYVYGLKNQTFQQQEKRWWSRPPTAIWRRKKERWMRLLAAVVRRGGPEDQVRNCEDLKVI